VADVAEVVDLAADGVERVLVVVAHPDDVDFGAAGTVAQLVRAGVEVAYCIVTNGDAGSDDRTHTAEQLSAIRQGEQRAAAAEVGVDHVVFLGYRDGQVEPTIELRRDLSRVIRQVRPDRMLVQSPERNWERIYASHPDHLAAGEAAMRAVYPDARNHHAHPILLAEGLEPHTVREVWLMASAEANLVVDITETFDQKLAALRCHQSQVGDGEHLEPLLREWGHSVAASAGLPAGRLAEGFRRVATA